MTVPLTDMHAQVMFCGTKSGRDLDKYRECGLALTAARKVSSPVIDTPAIQFECKIVYKSAMDPVHLKPDYERLYPEKNYHTLYFGEIRACYESE